MRSCRGGASTPTMPAETPLLAETPTRFFADAFQSYQEPGGVRCQAPIPGGLPQSLDLTGFRGARPQG
jgi:hypothetical protein